MDGRDRHVRVGLAAGLTLALLIGQVLSAAPAAAAESLPNSIASTGDSITRAFNTGGSAFTDNPAASWSTGTDPSVDSHYSRLLRLNPAISGKTFNQAVSGAKMADLAAQLAGVNGLGVDYVTVLMGANDVCASSESAMTSVASFRAQFDSAMRAYTTASPSARVFVASVPDVFNLWAILKDNASARLVWGLVGICQSMLANPLSTAPADNDRRSRVRQRNIDFNTQLAQICALYPRCRFDGNAAFNTPYSVADVSARDFFHPSLVGLAKLASVSWSAGYWAGLPVGGRGFALTPGALLTWTGGLQQAGYLIARLTDSGTQVLPPGGSPLPANTVTYTDASPPSGLACYLLFALGPNGTLGNSDLLCRVDGIAAGAVPANFTVRLSESSVASFSWTAPGSQDGYLLAPIGGTLVTLPGTATGASVPIAAPTCFALYALSGATVLGNTDVLCAFPGYASFGPAPSSLAEKTTTLRRAVDGYAPRAGRPGAGVGR